eukprot:2088619-Amphidinium_carterae.1
MHGSGYLEWTDGRYYVGQFKVASYNSTSAHKEIGKGTNKSTSTDGLYGEAGVSSALKRLRKRKLVTLLIVSSPSAHL